ncbi:hypothetical protein FJ959_22225 [Mesorhizobium sp. B2-2-4]|uniref:hypothetical protein n=1 Tax=unclassified Mesorhizobium TaxID=325217 RepID=UPI00112995B1|nr:MULTISPECIES: hypothetical protein [unclassified Mesorhizobium]TPM53251.1 hypothetical protein FJ959_22225 [Mesorhizobium sp. B2-2-4]TPM62107.1 hypothetical protein FJ965_21145 [Mesorhizobium sp. B2-2-1]TPN68478.1 hypothetical protein FJ984_11625 [Mesorhizobium sp. B1-1-3]
MTVLAASLYLLGVIGAAAAVGRDVPAGLREWIVIVGWPLAVAYAVASVPVSKFWARSFRP